MNRSIRSRSLCLFVILNVFAVSAWISAGQITVQNAPRVQRLAQLKGHTGPVFSLAFSPNSKMLVSGGSAQDHSARTWDVAAGTQRALLAGNEKQIAAVAFSGDGARALSAGYDYSIRIWDATQGKQVAVINKTADQGPLMIDNLVAAFSADGSKFAYSNDLGQGPFLFDVNTRKQLNLNIAPAGPEGMMGPIALNGAGTVLAVSAGSEGAIRMIDLKTGKQTGVLKPSEVYEGGGVMAFSRDGALLAASIDGPSDIQLFDVAAGKPGALLTGHKKNTNGMLSIMGLAFSPDHNLLASASYDKTVRLWDVHTGKLLATLDASGKGPATVAWSPDGTVVASGDLDGTISIWGIK